MDWDLFLSKILPENTGILPDMYSPHMAHTIKMGQAVSIFLRLGKLQESLVQVKWTELPFRFNVMKTSNYPHSYLNLNNYDGTCPILCFVVDKTDPDRSTAWYQCHRFWYHSRRAYLLPRRMEIYILNRHSRSLVFHWLWIDVLVNDLVLDRVHVL